MGMIWKDAHFLINIRANAYQRQMHISAKTNLNQSYEPLFQTSCLKKTISAHHLQSTIPKVKTEGLIRVEEKLNAPKYLDSPEHSEPETGQKINLPTGQ